ncbi:MAG: hypothetical protein HY814_00265 [Candidatus Riflebacteria bacterium]|nr:hypothetical protein [Candidatus Riflebacteria bacterium]
MTPRSDLAVTLGRITLTPCVMNAAGPRSLRDGDLQALTRSHTGAIVVGPVTVAARAGQDSNDWYVDVERGQSGRTEPLENPGCEAYAEQLRQLRARCDRPLVVSVVGFTVDEYVRAARILGRVADAIELDLAWPGAATKTQLGHDFQMVHQVLQGARETTTADLWVKLPPYQDIGQIEAMARLLVSSRVHAVVASGPPAGLDLDLNSETSRLACAEGLCGIGGRDVLRQARWNIREMWRALGGTLPVIGAGGVWTGEDAFGHVLCGAAAVQIGTAYLAEGPAVFARLEKELKTVAGRKKLGSLLSKVGALQD